ncbi:MAG: AMP-binding protein [Hyphomicrobiales bacterium]|nr:AMP-binding protein [Hyphomicrobiales bacterium]MBV9518635.1 AMP-binding protein [Hyphomicrobiales bacterium]
MRDYQEAYSDLSVEELANQVLHGRLADGMNAAIECCDRWVGGDHPALNWISKDFAEEKTITFEALRDQSARFANLLRERGIGQGDVVAGLLPRIPELLVVTLGAWRVGAIYQPLFTAFGPAAIESRVTAAGGSRAKLIVTDEANRPKLDKLANCPPVMLVGNGFAAALAAQSAESAPVMLRGEDPFVILFTSGTTGNPKAVRWPLRILLNIAIYMRDAIGLESKDHFWNVADPGWAYGMAFSVIGPLQLGLATTFFEGGFTVEAALRLIVSKKITNIAAAPTVYRLMMAAGDAMGRIAGQLRVASSAGEPLNPEVMRWAERVLRSPLRDHYGQTEILMVVNNHHALDHAVRPGAAGLPMPGFSVAVLDGDLRPVPPDTPGVLAVHRPTSPLFAFDGYWGADTPSFRGEWYLTGDTVQQDAEGHIFFVGRNDDIITSAGYRIGPFDVESSIIEHPAVAEVAVVGKPDPERTEIVKAFIVLRPGVAASEELKAELRQHVRTRLGLHAYPREIEFIEELPKTPSGKVQRFLLRRR